MTKVYRNEQGDLINIGAWDFMEEDVTDSETQKVTRVIHNPLPDGAVESEEETEIGWDGGVYIKGDPRAQKS